MNTWGYLILITALLVLAGVMLYARFSTRSREKSLHHSPSDWYLGSETLELPPVSEDPVPAAEPEFLSQVRMDRVSSETETTPTPPATRDYLDELQEAAAGLAKLMRSSPVTRSEPVVYAPESVDEPVAAVAAEAEEPLVVSESEPVAHHEPVVAVEAPVAVEAAPEVIEVEEAAFVSLEHTVAEPVVEVPHAEIAEEVTVPRILSLRELLGDSVADQFDHIDAELDALEGLVSSIEENLILLSNYERPVEDTDIDGEEASPIAAAA